MHHHEIVEACARTLGRVQTEGIDRVLGPVHPAANALPLLDVDALAELASSILTQGYLSSFPVVVMDVTADHELPRILDGRNRLLACVALGWDGKSGAGPKPRIDVVSELSEVDAVRLVRAATTRREMDLQTRTVALAALHRLESEAAAAEGRRRGGATPKGEGAGVERGVERTALAVAAETGESPRTVRRRLQVERTAVPEVKAALRSGSVEPSVAADVASLPADVQAVALVDPEVRRAVLASERERKATARDARKAREADAARASAPDAPLGVDIRLCDVADLLADPALRGAQLVHADPPWTYDRTNGPGAADAEYTLLDMDAIVAHLDAAYDLAAEDARLVVWCTWVMLADFLAAIAGTRWTYLTGGSWHKSGNPGIGYHWRGTTEPVLVLRKGAPSRSTAALPNGWIAPRSAHSEKPAGWLEQIVRAWVPAGGLVVDLYAGRAPLARACHATGRRYVGAEIDPDRHVLALAALGAPGAPEPTPPEPTPAPPEAGLPLGRDASRDGRPIREVAAERGWAGTLRALAPVLVAEGWKRGPGLPVLWYPPAAETGE